MVERTNFIKEDNKMNKIIKSVVFAILASSIALPVFAEEGTIRMAKEGEKVKIDGTEYELIEEDTTAGEHIYKVKDGGREMCIPAWDSAERREGGFCCGSERPAVLRIIIRIKNNLNDFVKSNGAYFGQTTSVKNESSTSAGSKYTSYSYFDTAIDVFSAEGDTEAVFFKTNNPDVAEHFCGEKIIGLTEEEVSQKYGVDSNGRTFYRYGFEAGDIYASYCTFTFKDGKVCEISYGENDYLRNYSGYLCMKLPEANLLTVAHSLGDSVRIRETPVDGNPIGKVDKTSLLYVMEFQKQPNDSVWAHVKTEYNEGKESVDGWMHSDYVSINEVSPSANSQLVNTLYYYSHEVYHNNAIESDIGSKVFVDKPNASLTFDKLSIKIGDDINNLLQLLPFFKMCMFDCPENIDLDDWVIIEDQFCKAKLTVRVNNHKITSFSIESGY